MSPATCHSATDASAGGPEVRHNQSSGLDSEIAINGAHTVIPWKNLKRGLAEDESSSITRPQNGDSSFLPSSIPRIRFPNIMISSTASLQT